MLFSGGCSVINGFRELTADKHPFSNLGGSAIGGACGW